MAWSFIHSPVVSQGPLSTTQSTTPGTVVSLIVLRASFTLSSSWHFFIPETGEARRKRTVRRVIGIISEIELS